MEYLDITDENGTPTGKTIDRNTAHREGILHRTAHVWIVRREKGRIQVLLQKRSRDKESFPGMYDTSSAGHIPAGDEPLFSALRELNEELGIHAEEKDLEFAGMFRGKYEKEFHGHMFRDNEAVFVYVLKKDVNTQDLILQESVVEEVRWFDLKDVYEEIRTDRSRFCVPSGGLELLIRFLEKKHEIDG